MVPRPFCNLSPAASCVVCAVFQSFLRRLKTLLCGDQLVIVACDLEGDFLVRLDKISSRCQCLGFRRADVGFSLAKVEDKILQRNFRLYCLQWLRP